MWICHTATPRALLAMPATCKDVAAATRASGKARDPQRCCRGNDGRRESAKPLGAMRALGGARRRFERNAQMPTENDRQTWPDTASPRCIAAVRVDRRTGRYRRLRAGARSRAAPQKRNCAPRLAGKGAVIGAIEGGKASPEVAAGRSATRSCRRRGWPTYSLALLIVIAPAPVDSGGPPAQARRGLTPARSP
jgi:hypothetical protein